MGLRFDLRVANWLAHVLQPDSPMPQLGSAWDTTEALRIFVSRLRNQFLSSPHREYEFHRLITDAERMLQRVDEGEPATTIVLRDLRRFLGGRPWTALLVPSGRDRETDSFICSEEFLRDLVDIRTEDPGLILQLQEAPGEAFALTDIFPAFRTALSASTDWPGILD